jgi:hypothetical protein
MWAWLILLICPGDLGSISSIVRSIVHTNRGAGLSGNPFLLEGYRRYNSIRFRRPNFSQRGRQQVVTERQNRRRSREGWGNE